MKKQFPAVYQVAEVLKLYRPKTTGGGILSVAHGGVGFRLHDGRTFVLHRTPAFDTHISSYEEFKAGQEVTATPISLSGLNDILGRAELIFEQRSKYSIFTNCEHLTNFVLDGVTESEQLKAGMLGLGGGVVLSLTALAKQPTWVKLLATGVCVAGAVHYQKTKQLGY